MRACFRGQCAPVSRISRKSYTAWLDIQEGIAGVGTEKGDICSQEQSRPIVVSNLGPYFTIH